MISRVAQVEVGCLLFAGVGLVLAALGHTALLAPWRAGVAGELFGTPGLPSALGPLVMTTNAILGGSIVGKWVAAWFLARHGLRAGHGWAWTALVAGHLTWFCLDSGLSLALGAVSNILLINLLPGIGFLALLVRARPRDWSAAPERSGGRAWTALIGVCGLMVAIGLALVVGARSPLFGVYNAALDARFGGGSDVATWVTFAYGLVGATFAAHFVMLGLAARQARGAPWVGRAALISTLAWFFVDTTGSALQGAWFNIALINVPSLIAVGLPVWLVRRR